jgi:uridylate kinase
MNPMTARMLPNVDATEALSRKLDIMDRDALQLAIANPTQIQVVSAEQDNALCDVLTGATIGSTIHAR